MQKMTTKSALEKLAEIKKTRSYEKIGKDLGVSLQTVYRWLQGDNEPSPMAVEKIIKYVKAKK